MLVGWEYQVDQGPTIAHANVYCLHLARKSRVDGQHGLGEDSVVVFVYIKVTCVDDCHVASLSFQSSLFEIEETAEDFLSKLLVVGRKACAIVEYNWTPMIVVRGTNEVAVFEYLLIIRHCTVQRHGQKCPFGAKQGQSELPICSNIFSCGPYIKFGSFQVKSGWGFAFDEVRTLFLSQFIRSFLGGFHRIYGLSQESPGFLIYMWGDHGF
mmetsp:Transcript_26076/g.71805  ORF Transcript_26076/g.71805 Transcript_26076/m.71805 type:complete len:211 (+) Transcript_26076:2373-3005(+)